MTATAKALALYHRTKAQYHHLTRHSLIPADHNHLTRPLTLASALHRSPTPPRPSRRPLTTALRHLLAAAFPPPPSPTPLPPPIPTTPALRPRPCRLCAATEPHPSARRPSAEPGSASAFPSRR
ncbi:hypothetical protein GCM10017774_90740 [Lentzea cavernae]|uniref:Uncharacterized protein n=1 Tax=Lentzea cavernae TaxID=2020703 RepID=A0ABQ3N4R8_9PSEU|nr:hypothetical protein GCM10017774_90740 [Lentzea cavernae]